MVKVTHADGEGPKKTQTYSGTSFTCLSWLLRGFSWILTWIHLDSTGFRGSLADFRSLPFSTVALLEGGREGCRQKRLASAHECWWWSWWWSWWWLWWVVSLLPSRQVRRRTTRTRHSARQTKRTLPAPNPIEFGVGKVHFGIERDKKAPTTNLTSISPCFTGKKIRNCGRQVANNK